MLQNFAKIIQLHKHDKDKLLAALQASGVELTPEQFAKLEPREPKTKGTPRPGVLERARGGRRRRDRPLDGPGGQVPQAVAEDPLL